MKNLFFSFLFIALGNVCFAQDESKYLTFDYEFEEGMSYKLFGDKVKLRNKPSAESTVLDTLDIGSNVQILKKTKESMWFNGIESSWYKVKIDNQFGYVLGGLISLDDAVIGNDTYLISPSRDTNYSYLNIRLLAPEATNYFESTVTLFTSLFSINAYNNRGLEGVTSIFFVDLHAEACGENGGGTYLFHDELFFEPVIELSSISEAGLFHFSEELTFPDEMENPDGSILYIREASEYMDEEMNWEQSTINRVKIRWEDRKLTPNPIDFFNED